MKKSEKFAKNLKKSLLYSIILQEKDDWKKFEKNNPAVSLNVLYVKRMYVYPAYISKHNSNYEKQIILLTILNGEGWHYLVVKKLCALLAGITSKHDGNFYWFNCLYSFRTRNKLESHKKLC